MTPPPPVSAARPIEAESLVFGHVHCDFIRWDDFIARCQQYLASHHFHHIVTLNPEMVMQAEHNLSFRRAVAHADLRVPDGSGLVWAQWYIRSLFWSLLPSLLAFPFRAVERITGVDTVYVLAKLCSENQQTLYLLGGTSKQVRRTAAKLKQRYPSLRVVTAPDHTYDLAGPVAIVADIERVKPAVLLVAYGAPKQTEWIEHHRSKLSSVRIAVGVGGAFAILSEETPRAPRLLRQLNLEWLWRLLLEPTRLPRIWQATVAFPLLVKNQKSANPPLFPDISAQ